MEKLKSLFRKSADTTAFRNGSYSVMLTAVVTAILVAVNVLFSVMPSSMTKYDISSSQLYSVTSNTKVVVNALDKDVTIYWICQDGEEDDVIENLLSKYESLSDHITVVKKNPDIYPTFASQYTSGTVANNSLIVECGDKYRYISYNDIYLQDVDYTTYSYVYEFDGEGAITSAVDYVVSDEFPVMYVLSGHGEENLPDEFTRQIEKANIETETFSLLNEDSIPDDAACVLIYEPQSDISEEEAEILSDYADNGGKLFVIAGPARDSSLENLNGILSEYGVTAREGIVIESDRNYYAFSRPYILLPEINSSDITDSLIDENYYAIMPVSQGFTVDNSSADVTQLLTTSASSFAKRAGYSLTTYDREDGDTDGPFALALSVNTDGDGSIVWIGSAYFLEEQYNSYSSGANLDMAMNALTYLIGDEDTIAISSKSLSYNYLTISDTVSSVLKTVMILVIPAAFLCTGIAIVVTRRSRKNVKE